MWEALREDVGPASLLSGSVPSFTVEMSRPLPNRGWAAKFKLEFVVTIEIIIYIQWAFVLIHLQTGLQQVRALLSIMFWTTVAWSFCADSILSPPSGHRNKGLGSGNSWRISLGPDGILHETPSRLDTTMGFLWGRPHDPDICGGGLLVTWHYKVKFNKKQKKQTGTSWGPWYADWQKTAVTWQLSCSQHWNSQTVVKFDKDYVRDPHSPEKAPVDRLLRPNWVYL